MRVLIGALILGLCAWRTHTRAGDWRSDQALWTAATVSAPQVPRPWLNLAAAKWRTGQFAAAWPDLERAVEAVARERYAPMQPGITYYARKQLYLLDAVEPRCDTPRWRPLCASLE